ncbi:MAG: porin family protein [Mediterranea massiliensis]|nr:porin family protein [Mediterranea massiliensis]
MDKFCEKIQQQLTGVQMDVRDGFWEEIEACLPVAVTTPRYRFLKRWSIAASILLVLGCAAFAWLNGLDNASEGIYDEVAQLPVVQNSTIVSNDDLFADYPEQTSPALVQNNATRPAANRAVYPAAYHQVALSDKPTDEPYIHSEVHVRVTVTQTRKNAQETTQTHHNTSSSTPSAQGEIVQPTNESPWSMKTFLGTSLPHEDFALPLSAGITIERKLSKRISLESGLIYNRLEGIDAVAEKRTLHTLEVPLKMNVTVAEGKRTELYATAGAAIEKCIAGAIDNGFDAEPLSASVKAGVGVNYKLSDCLAMFGEATLSHRLADSSQTRTIHNERPTNMNLCCGLRMRL